MKQKIRFYVLSIFCLATLLPISCGKGAVKSAGQDVTVISSLNDGGGHKSGGTHKKSIPPLSLEDIWSRLKPESITLNAPAKMMLGMEQTVTLDILGKLPVEDLTARVKKGKFAGDLKGVKKVVVSDALTAKLTGDGFAITLGSNEQQSASSDKTEWIWKVTPNQEGEQRKLQVELLATVNLDGVDKSQPVTTLESTVNVFLSPVQIIKNFFMNPWVWIFLLILIVAGIMWISRIKTTDTKHTKIK